MQRLKYKGLADRKVKEYEIDGNAVIVINELFEGFLLSQAVIQIDAEKDTSIEVDFLSPTDTTKVVGKEIHQLYFGERGYIRLDTPFAQLKISGKAKVTVVGLQRNY